MSAAIILDNVTKSFRLKHGFTLRQALANRKYRRDPRTMIRALDRISARVEEGRGLALMGLNGSGKSTLLKLISGVMRPDSGTVHVRGRIAGLLELNAGFHPELSCRENIYLNGTILGMSRSELDRRFDDIVDFAGIDRFLDTQVRFLSSGMFTRLGFAVAINTRPDVFLVDEVLSIGDGQFKRRCRKALEVRRREDGLTLIVVAHEAELLRQLCSDAIVLAAGRAIYQGDLPTAEHVLEAQDSDTR